MAMQNYWHAFRNKRFIAFNTISGLASLLLVKSFVGIAFTSSALNPIKS